MLHLYVLLSKKLHFLKYIINISPFFLGDLIFYSTIKPQLKLKSSLNIQFS